ncbi:phosphate uptake regulator PhoU [Candidatus Hecatella orcuttiae]|jgi:phosphate uptake regulator|uniref:phosphate uptake regulator PhoU n=1 Tax=Candidatus Hecatella orcuttiae TaxID=1935119 RepID=UPI00286829ED|nr:phosphate uptake regulator PhoU [Candidatus Hecatella orcuttiae]
MNHPSEWRKIQLTGGSTYVVSLPKEWAKEVGLTPGSPVALLRQPDASLLIVPEGDTKRESFEETLLEVSPKVDPEVVVRDFIARYLVGYDLIQVKFGLQTTRHRDALKKIIKGKLMGVEIIEESADGLTAQCLLGYKELPVDRALNRMSVLASLMHKDALAALTNWDHMLAHEVVLRDDEVDRFYFFMVRQLKKAVYNRAMIREFGLATPRDCLGYRLIVKSIERVADHAARIAHTVLTMDGLPDEKYLRGITAMSSLSQEVYADSLKALYKADIKLAHETIAKTRQIGALEDEIVEQLLNFRLANTLLIKLRVVIESIRRTAEYGADIAEIILNLNADKTVKY